MKAYEVTLRNPITGYTWHYYTTEVTDEAAAKRQAEFYGMGCKAISAKPIEG